MHIFWFILMVLSFMSLVSNNVRVILNIHRDPNYYKREKNTPQLVGMAVGHIINYVIFYFALTNFIGHMVARY